MMKIDKNTIERLAFLSQMAIPEENIDAEIKRLEQMADVIAVIREQNTDGTEIMCNPHDAHMILRDDVVTETNHREEYQKTTEFTDNGLYLVPQVIE
ncbi:Asp-tRNA(Asn)/Glu-tRNA(Gln) amidotransferase subunit GatC [Ignatzschineria sp. RMDPL8A]|uniref:Asp-tRNA(Asn)/Glu-tRNA(Gln) amidotransferase subunit GatC n=1 Tax=Ignatzschineria sp. RMDPL8A TaxID=2999236 RepID=UPI00168F2622|nr:Asp-tRNA(Asn)/Glu-tRNA(Gln) amidotransferase subunit GatC [Ignatzschineria sp. RMDPL8A]MDG9730477.1 Asp-tRNA(Asn)/Glu-tRNA(Gln) amidotransferase subunit GatC [Ignatzschineria sp. RMDPL8A]NLD09869.1 Asp-tRNA(Asn)/Glu-tRNA(Gln) amidotransferase subunit GatC [Xanthomonadaceae bacterium]